MNYRSEGALTGLSSPIRHSVMVTHSTHIKTDRHVGTGVSISDVVAAQAESHTVRHNELMETHSFP